MSWREAVVGGLIFVVGLGFIGEMVFRKWRIQPRVVTIDATHASIDVERLHDRWVWIEHQSRSTEHSPGRWNLPCLEQDARRVFLFGDSIFFGSGLGTPDSLGHRLEEALAAQHPDESWCVMNFAQPGATLGPQLAFFEEYLPRARPQDLVVFEFWYGSPREPTRIGDRLFYLDGVRADDAGYPAFAFGLSGAWHHWLFENSRFWEYLTFAVSPPCNTPECLPDWNRLVSTQLEPAVASARAQGVPVQFTFMPPLDRPFAELIAEPMPWYDPVLAYADASQIPTVRAETLLADEDVYAVRLDDSCHYNALGTERLAHGLAPVLRNAAGVAATEP